MIQYKQNYIILLTDHVKLILKLKLGKNKKNDGCSKIVVDIKKNILTFFNICRPN